MHPKRALSGLSGLVADVTTRLQAAQLLAALCSGSPPVLLDQLVAGEVVEYLCECIRCRSNSEGWGSCRTGRWGGSLSTQASSAVARDQTALLQATVVCVLQSLGRAGALEASAARPVPLH